MNLRRNAVCAAAIVAALAAGQARANELANDDQKRLYALGALAGRNLAIFNLTPEELELVKAGLVDAATGATLKVDPQPFIPLLNAMAQERAKKRAETEKASGQVFLAECEKEPGAVKLPSGVIYVETQAGTGDTPKPTDQVKVHYRGTLRDGKEFDASKPDNPVEFPLNQVIPCWTEGVGKMKVGGKARLVCPSETAYGDMGSPPQIPPGAALVFEVELVDIVKPEPPAPAVAPAAGGGTP